VGILVMLVAVYPDQAFPVAWNTPWRYAVFCECEPLLVFSGFCDVFVVFFVVEVEGRSVVIGIHEILVGEDKGGNLEFIGQVEGSLGELKGVFQASGSEYYTRELAVP